MKFFIAYIMVPVFGSLCPEVRFDISRYGLRRAGVRCRDLIPFYKNCTAFDKAESRYYLHSLFTEREVLQVKRFFAKLGHAVIVEETTIPRPCRSIYPAHHEAIENGIYCEKISINRRLRVFVSAHSVRMCHECGPDYYDPDCEEV